jgi:hypothetical protein
MGHIRLGSLPKTHKWQEVVGLVAENGSATAVADATMDAAQRGLEIASRDEGLRHTLWLLTQITLAARQDNFAAALQQIGLPVHDTPTVFDIVGGFSEAVDDHLRRTGDRTDIGEMAQMAAAETLTALCSAKSASLWETTAADVQEAVRSYSTQAGFSNLAHDFFSRLTQRYLTYHLSRELSTHVGEGKRFTDINAHTQFIDQLNTSCRQAALIVKEFAGGWYSKTNYESGITPVKARNFAWVALKKIRAELKIRGGRDA